MKRHLEADFAAPTPDFQAGDDALFQWDADAFGFPGDDIAPVQWDADHTLVYADEAALDQWGANENVRIPNRDGYDGTLDQWDSDHDTAILYILKQYVLPLGAPDPRLIAGTHCYDIDPERFDARVTRAAAYIVRECLETSAAKTGIDAHPLLSERPPFIDMYEAALYFNDQAAVARMDAVLAAPATHPKLKEAHRKHVLRFGYAMGRGGTTGIPSQLDDNVYIGMVVGLVVGGHAAQLSALLGAAPGMWQGHFAAVIACLQKMDQLPRLFAEDRLFSLMCQAVADDPDAWPDIVTELLDQPAGKRQVLIGLTQVFYTLPVHDRLPRTADSRVLTVLFELVDPANERAYTRNQYADILGWLGFDVPASFAEAEFPSYMAPLLMVPMTQTVVGMLDQYAVDQEMMDALYYQLVCEDKLHLLPANFRTPRAPIDGNAVRPGLHVTLRLDRVLVVIDQLVVVARAAAQSGCLPIFHGLTPHEWTAVVAHMRERQLRVSEELCWQFLYLHADEDAARLALLPHCQREFFAVGILTPDVRLCMLSCDALLALANHIGPLRVLVQYIDQLIVLWNDMGAYETHLVTNRRASLPLHNAPSIVRQLVDMARRVATPPMDFRPILGNRHNVDIDLLVLEQTYSRPVLLAHLDWLRTDPFPTLEVAQLVRDAMESVRELPIADQF